MIGSFLTFRWLTHRDAVDEYEPLVVDVPYLDLRNVHLLVSVEVSVG